jgi:hypothetical protein
MDERNQDEARVLLYKLIYQVLIEIREEAFYIKSGKIHKLSALAHNLPLKLLKPDRDFKALLEEVRGQAHSIGAGKWFENAIKQL